ncbi:MAG: serine hydrolase [Thermoanaerobaculia bacterium]
MRRWSSLLVWILCLLGPAAGAWAADPAGHWQGAIELPGQQLAYDIDLAQDASGHWSGDISIPAQGARDLPLAGFAVEPPKVGFEIQGIPGKPTFAGELSADGGKISGTFTQGGQSFPFQMERGATGAARATQSLQGFDTVVAQILADLNLPGLGVGIVKDGEVILARGYGFRDVEAKLPVTADTLFAIGSSTKAFTTFVLASLVAEGKLDWDTPVRRYLPSFRLFDPTASEIITPRDLVTHRSGLPRHDLVWYNNQAAPRAELVSRLAYLEPTATLRQKFQYNNLMFLTAGYLAEQLTGKSWEQNVRERIFLPLGMSHSNFDVADSQRAPDFAQPYVEREEKLVKVPFRPIGNMGPAGSINSSVNDMVRWVAYQLTGKAGGKELLPPALLAELHATQMPMGNTAERPEISATSYAMGWMSDTFRGHARLHHGGNIDGFSAMVTLLPQDGLGLVVLSNKESSGVPELVVREALDRLLELKPIGWEAEALARRKASLAAQKGAKSRLDEGRKTGTHPAHPLAEYAGFYHHPGYGDLTVQAAGKGLELTYNHLTLPLEHWHYEVWSPKGVTDPILEDFRLKFRFVDDMDGNVAGIRTQFEPTLGEVEFVRQPDPKLSDPSYLAKLAGAYDLEGETVKVVLSGSELLLSQPGSPLMHLVPQVSGRFQIREASVISLRFDLDAQGKVVSLTSFQPNGVYTLKRLN